MVAVSLVSQSDDDVVCELLEDLSEEEEGDDKGESSFDETTFVRFQEYTLVLDWEVEVSSTSFFSEASDMPFGLPKEISTPPPENTMC